MTNQELANELIRRLNELIVDPQVKSTVGSLIETRVKVPYRDHASIIVSINESPLEGADSASYEVGLLGLLNGVVGRIGGDGPHHAYGLITAQFDDDGFLEHFKRTTEP